MQSLGNDFVVIDQIKNIFQLNKKLIKKICGGEISKFGSNFNIGKIN